MTKAVYEKEEKKKSIAVWPLQTTAEILVRCYPVTAFLFTLNDCHVIFISPV